MTTSTRHRVLVIANETAASDTVHAVVRSLTHGSANARVRVVAPLDTRLHQRLSDGGLARREAVRRLQTAVENLTRRGIHAEGMIGQSDAVQAIEDALATFAADEIVVSTLPEGRSNWLARDVVQRTEMRFGLPVTHVVVDDVTGRDLVVYAAPALLAA